PSAKRQRGDRLNALIIAVLGCAVAFLLYQRFRPTEASAGVPDKSIAVLPFDNFSDEKENAFFADGIQDDILTSLAKIRDLKVISRTSVMVYRGAAKNNLPQIAQALGVVNVLQGSVRRGGNRVVVSVQLIDARNDRQLSATLARIYHWFDPTDERKVQIKKSADKALELKPDLGEGHLALGLYYYWTEANYDKALEEFHLAAAALPNDSEISYVAAGMRRRQGKWNDNLELLKKT